MLSVTKTSDGTLGIIKLSISEITFLEYDRKIDRVLVHTNSGMYYTVGTLKYWIAAFNSSSYIFHQVDRNAVVNVNRITAIDTDFKLIHFDTKITESKSCTLAWSKFSELVELLEYNTHLVEIN